MSSDEVNDVLSELRYEDDGVDAEMREYIEQVISMITTGDEEEDMKNMETIASTIAAQRNVSLKQAKENLMQLRKEFYDSVEKGNTPEQARVGLGYKIYKGGLIIIKVTALSSKGLRTAALVGTGGSGVALAGSAIIGPLAWTFVGVVYLAETGINYRRYKRGAISKEEFKSRLKQGAVGTVGGLACASAGAALGFVIGSACFPVVGSIVGVLVGGVAGGVTGKRLSLKMMSKIEAKMAKIKELN